MLFFFLIFLPRKEKNLRNKPERVFPTNFPSSPQQQFDGAQNSLAVFLGSIDGKIEPSNAGQPAIFPHHIMAITLAGTIESAPPPPRPGPEPEGTLHDCPEAVEDCASLARFSSTRQKTVPPLFRLDFNGCVCVCGGRRSLRSLDGGFVNLKRVRLGLHLESFHLPLILLITFRLFVCCFS